MNRFANRIVNKLTLHQWMNVEYGIVKRQYKELSNMEKEKIDKEYEQYLKDLKGNCLGEV